MWSTTSTLRPLLCMIYTAVAPEAVLTLGTSEPIDPGYRPPEHPPSETLNDNPQVSQPNRQIR